MTSPGSVLACRECARPISSMAKNGAICAPCDYEETEAELWELSEDY